MTARFGRVLPAMVTAFDADGALDIDASVLLARWLIDQGSEGLVVTGTTGEGPTITDEEDWQLWQAITEAVTVPVIIGCTNNDTKHSIDQVKMARQCGADAILAVTPYYNKPSQAGIYAHFEAIASASDLPVMVYDIPGRTSRNIETDTLIAMSAEIPTVVALKDAAGSPEETAKVIAGTRGLDVYSGDDSLTLALAAVGAVGVVSVCAHWTAPEMVNMFDAIERGDLVEARRYNTLMLDSYDFETSAAAPNPVPTKAMLRTIGLAVGETRLPMGPTPDGLEAEAKDIYNELLEHR